MIHRAKYETQKKIAISILSAAIALTGLVSVAAQDQAERAPLKNDAPTKARLSKGETHRYPVQLTSGEYVQVEAKALSGDITLELTAPDGGKLMKLIALKGLPEGKAVSTVAEMSASHFVKIAALDPQQDGIEYQVRISELRPAEVADRARSQGDHLFAAGEEIYERRTKEGFLEAIEKYKAALPHYERAEDWFGAANAVETMGEAYYRLADYREASSAFERSLPLVRKAKQTAKTLSLEAKITNNIGVIASTQYNNQKALNYYLQAIDLYRRLNNRVAETFCLINIGIIYTATGQPEEALLWYERALAINRELNIKQLEASTLNNRGVSRFFQGQYQQAIEDQKASLELWRKLSNSGKQGWTLANLAADHIALQQPQAALELLDEGLPLIKKGGSKRDEAYAVHCLGDAHRLLGGFEKAIEYYQRALDLRQGLDEKILDAFSITKIAQIETLRENYDEALLQSNRALALVEQVRQQYSNPLLGASYSSSTHHYYADHIALLLKLHTRQPRAGYDVQAFQTSERAHARALLESLSEIGQNLRSDMPAALTEREAVQQKAIDRIISEQAKVAKTATSGTRSAKLQELENELRQVMTEADELQGQMRASHPRYTALLRPQPLTPAEIQRQLLSPDSLLLEYFVAQDRLYLFALTTEGEQPLHVVEIPDKAAVEKAAGFFQRRKFESAGELQNRFTYSNPEFAKTVQYLSDKLLAPVTPLLNKRKIWIVSDGNLQRIPFAVLPDPRRTSTVKVRNPGRGGIRRSTSIKPFIVDHEIAVLPSASTVAWLRKAIAARPPAPGGIAVIADPVFSADDERVKDGAPQTGQVPATIAQRFRGSPDFEQVMRDLGGLAGTGALNRLPASRTEAQSIARLAPENSLIAMDFDANREMVMSGKLRDFRYLHFATHAYVDDIFPGLSWLALSQVDRKGEEQPGYLRLNDIYQLQLNADLVVLGACRTGLGKQLQGEGMIGLTRGFIYAGVPRVLVSLWDVPDRETAQLMQSFYRNLLKQNLPVAEALQRAQVDMWKRSVHNAPFFWAAFTLQGDPEK
jgi:CHAT domain-containing protein